MLFSFGFTIMHAVFILYTGMAVDLGGLGYNEAQNGRIFAIIGVAGILTQGILIGPLSRRFGPAKLLPVSCVLSGLGLALIPYTNADWALIQLFLVVVLVAVGNGIFQPTSSSLLTTVAKREGANLGVVMGAQESVSSFARIIGPLTGGVVWTFTVTRSWPLDYHKAFHLCGIIMFCAAILSLKVNRFADDNLEES